VVFHLTYGNLISWKKRNANALAASLTQALLASPTLSATSRKEGELQLFLSK
jgi:hypothetical protein